MPNLGGVGGWGQGQGGGEVATIDRASCKGNMTAPVKKSVNQARHVKGMPNILITLLFSRISSY